MTGGLKDDVNARALEFGHGDDFEIDDDAALVPDGFDTHEPQCLGEVRAVLAD